MPTGYTAKVGDGTVTEFTEYALICARAFGACFRLRDEPLTSDIPEFEESKYYRENLEEAEKEYNEFFNSSEDQLREWYARDQAENKTIAEKGIAERLEIRHRYEKMLEKAEAFVPPSEEHERYAQFLVSQLEASIEADCDTEFYEKLNQEVPFDEWKQKQAEELRWSLEYAKKSYTKELERVQSSNQWVNQLKKALGVNQ